MSNAHIQIGSCVLVKGDTTSEVRLANGKSLSLTQPESSILRCLHQNIGQIVSKQDLIVAGWGRPDIIGPNSLPVAMANIRKVLSLAEIEIVNVPKVGYKLEVPPKTSPSPEQSVPPTHKVKDKNYTRIALSILSLTTIISIAALGFFVYSSWVKIDCREIASVTFCVNKKDAFEMTSIEALTPNRGETYYNSSGHWIKVKDNG